MDTAASTTSHRTSSMPQQVRASANLPRTSRTGIVMRSVSRSSGRSWRVWPWPLRPLRRRTWRIGPWRITALRVLVNTPCALGSSVVLEYVYYVFPTSTATATATITITTTSSSITTSGGSCVRTSNKNIIIQSPPLWRFVVALIWERECLPLVPDRFILGLAARIIVDNSTVTNG